MNFEDRGGVKLTPPLKKKKKKNYLQKALLGLKVFLFSAKNFQKRGLGFAGLTSL